MQIALAQIRNFVAALTVRQRITIGVSAIAVLAAVLGLAWFTSKPDFKTVVSGLDTASGQAMAARLAAKNIQYRVTPDGTGIEVPAGKIDAARVEIASGNLPKQARIGFEIFDQPNWAASEFSERINYQRAIEGELERTIGSIEGVESARVHIVPHTESLFENRERSAKASVLLRMSTQPSRELLDSLSRLVASSIDGLNPAAVTIMDSDTGRSFRGESTADWSHSSPLDQELTERLIATLEPVLGPGHVRAAVRVEQDVTSIEENQETYDPKSVVPLSSEKSEERNGGTLPAGVPGTSSNLPNAQGGQKLAMVSDSSQSSTSEKNTYAVNRLLRHTSLPAGRIRRVTAAVMVDDVPAPSRENAYAARRRSPEEMNQIQELTRAAIGLDVSRGDTLTVQNIAFARAVPEELAPPTAAQKTKRILREYSDAGRYVSVFLVFLLIYFLMFRPMKRQITSALKNTPLVTSRKVETVVQVDDSGLLDSASTPELKRAASLKKDLIARVKAEPASASRLLQNWIGEDVG